MVRRVDGMRNVIEIKTDRIHVELTAFTDGDVEISNLNNRGVDMIDANNYEISPALVGRE